MHQSLSFGTLLGGRYRIERPLGAGAMGSVYEGVQEGLGRKVAIKVLHTNLAFDRDAIARFQREAQAAAALGHPNIVQVIDFQWPQNEPPFLVMENLIGRSFADAIRAAGRIDPIRAAKIARQIASALEVAHAAGIIHRDIKPDNVFLIDVPGAGEVAKVLDFGIAKLDRRTDGQQTADGTMLGSPAYMAPEQARGGAIDPCTDVFALGSTLYRALSGQLPFDAPSLNALLFAIAEQSPPPLAQIVPGIDPRMAAIVDRAMQKNPAMRFQSAAEMRNALDAIAQGVSLSGPPHAMATSVSPPPHMSMNGPAPQAASVIMSAPPGPSPYAPGPMALAQPMPQKSGGGGGAVIAIVVVLFLFIVGAGIGGFVFYRANAGAMTTPLASASPIAAPSTSALAASEPAAPQQTPGALVPPGKRAPNNVHDAGIAPSPVAVVDAGVAPVTPPPAPKGPVYSGVNPSVSGGAFGDFAIDPAKAALATRQSFIVNCYTSLQTTGPDHQFTDFRFRVSKDGKILAFLGGPDGASAPRIPPLDQCVARAWVGVNIGKSEKNQDGDIVIAITARSPGNE